MRSEKTSKVENPQLVSFSQQCSSTPVGCVKDFLAKNNMTTLKYNLLVWLQLIFTCFLDGNQQ
jgi:hypothetical protein